jgi:hypothetical protein
MIRKSFVAFAASMMTLTAFTATLTVMTAGAQASVQSGERVA